ncbi:MAG: carbonic anhydrase [Mastigocoleus sp.]
MNRRKFLANVSIATIAGTVTVSGLKLQSQVLAKSKTKWGYIGKRGAENWGKLSPEFSTCKFGITQSPIDINSTVRAKLSEIYTCYDSTNLRILNNGHTIKVNYDSGSKLKLDGEEYELLQFHFHHPSEHKVDTKNFPMELHLVHKNNKGSLAVLGVFLKEGKENQTLQKIWEVLPTKKTSEKTFYNITIDASDLLPQDKDSYRYFGSLTTPPCSEIVKWIVYQEPVEISKAQIQKFAEIFPMNARPVQKINRRFILQSN